MDAGASAVGINLWPGSKRYVDWDTAQRLGDAAGSHVMRVGLVVNATLSECQDILESLPLDCLQLHGDEGPGQVSALLPRAFKAVRVSGAQDVEGALGLPGEFILVDSHVPGVVGGSGHTFDWSLAVGLARMRRIVVAGGLDADNVGEAIRTIRPWGVDVCSAVEIPGDPRRKDPRAVAAFVSAAITAFSRT